MKKMIKLSLVAATAVAGLTTTSSAAALADSIKNTTLTGSAEYRMEHRTYTNTNTNGENVKLNLVFKSKVNDKVTFVTQGVINTQGKNATTGEYYVNEDNTKSTAYAGMNVMQANFVYKNAGTTVVAGTQALKTPWTDAADGARAAGVLAMQNVGPVTVAAAHFRNSQMGIDKTANLGSANLTALAVIGAAGPVAVQAWYLDIATPDLGASDLPEGGDALALLATVKAGPASVNATYASLEGDKDSLKKQTLTTLVATVKAGPVSVIVGAADGGKDGDLVTFDPDAKVGFQSWNIRAGKLKQLDLSAYTAAVVVPAGPVSVKLQYTSADYKESDVAGTRETEVDEALLQVSYAMSKNFTTYLRYADVDFNDVATSGDFKRTRLSLKYTF